MTYIIENENNPLDTKMSLKDKLISRGSFVEAKGIITNISNNIFNILILRGVVH